MHLSGRLVQLTVVDSRVVAGCAALFGVDQFEKKNSNVTIDKHDKHDYPFCLQDFSSAIARANDVPSRYHAEHFSGPEIFCC